MVFVSMEKASREKRPKERSYRTAAEQRLWSEDELQRHTHRFTSVLAALCAPLLVLLSIPGLTEGWYVRKEGQSIVQERPDPAYVLATGGAALAMTILANISLLLRHVNTHPRFLTISAVALLILHILLNVPTLVVFAVRRGQADGYTLSTAFSLTATSTALAALVLALLTIDGIATKGFKERGTGLSGRQRSLVLAFSAFIGYTCVASVIFKYQSELTFIDSLYFAVQTFLTVGFGTPAPSTPAAQGVAILLATGGIILFAVVIAFVRLTALETLQRQYQQQERNIFARLRRNKEHGRAPSDDGSSTQSRVEEDEKKERCLREDELEEAVIELNKQRNLEFRSELFTSFAVLVVAWLIAAAVYTKLEGWDFFLSFYFVFIAFSSIGYGDTSPQTTAGRSFFIIWSLVGAGIITTFFSVLADFYSDRFKQTHQRSVLSRMITAIYPDKHLEQEIVEDEEQARRGTAGMAKQAAMDEIENRKMAAGESSGDGKDIVLADALLALLKDTRGHLDELVRSDGGQGQVVDRLVEDTMSDQNFDQKVRLKVLNDDALKRFVYLRRLQAKLCRLEELATSAIEESKGPSKGKAALEMQAEVEKDRAELAEAADRAEATEGER